MSPVAVARRTSRPLIAVLGAIAVVSTAARWQTPTTPPAAAAAALQDSTAVDTAKADSLSADSVAIDSLALDSAPVVIAPAPAAPATPAAWPVDPATGYTLVNGVPVVGRAFVMQKTDGLVKVETVAEDRINEALAPEAPIAASTYTPAPPTATRRFRGIMVQATLWGMDGKRSSIERRHFRPSSAP